MHMRQCRRPPELERAPTTAPGWPQVPYFPPLQSLADYPTSVCQRLVREAVEPG